MIDRQDRRKDRRKKKQRSLKNKNTRRYSSLAGKKHCGDVCGCKRSRKVEGHDRLRLQQTRQLKKKKIGIRNIVRSACLYTTIVHHVSPPSD